MRQAKVIYCKKPKKRRVYKRTRLLPFLVLIFLRLGLILTPIIYAWFYMVEHGTPHMLWEYEYYGSPGHPNITSCTYIGFNGVISFPAHECPLIDFMK